MALRQRLWYSVFIPKFLEKGGALGGTLIIITLELTFVWLVYYIFGLATAHHMPIWLTALLVLLVDRSVNFITTHAQKRRDRLRE